MRLDSIDIVSVRTRHVFDAADRVVPDYWGRAGDRAAVGQPSSSLVLLLDPQRNDRRDHTQGP